MPSSVFYDSYKSSEDA